MWALHSIAVLAISVSTSLPQHSCISMNWIVPSVLLKNSVNLQRWFFAWHGSATRAGAVRRRDAHGALPAEPAAS